MALLYSNENFPLAAVHSLRDFGHDVLTTLEAGQANQAIQDEAVVQYAINLNRIVITLNKRDFINIHRKNSNHVGIIVCSTDSDFFALAERVNNALQEHNPAHGKLIRVNKRGHTVDVQRGCHG